MVIQPRTIAVFYTAVFLAVASCAQGELSYDPDKGFMVIDKNDKTGKTIKPLMADRRDPARAASDPRAMTPQARDSADIHVGRKKDPPSIYFMSGQEYYKNGDFTNALQNFRYADSVNPRPVFKLWIGKTLRSLGKPDSMVAVMSGIVKKYPESDVADDAILEMAVHYQNNEDYESAVRLYTRISEQYPFGVSYTSGENLIDVVRELKKQIKAQLSNQLVSLGYGMEDGGEDLASAIMAFQKAKGVPETGRADRATALLIKKEIKGSHERDQKRQHDAAHAAGLRNWAVLAGVLGFILILVTAALFAKARGRARQINLLTETLADLDTGKL